MTGYELPIGIDIFRGRYRTSFSHPEAIEPNRPLEYTFALPNVDHTFQPGHRIMVQVQSTLFPLYDRNPQTFVPNIFDAKPETSSRQHSASGMNRAKHATSRCRWRRSRSKTTTTMRNHQEPPGSHIPGIFLN